MFQKIKRQHQLLKEIKKECQGVKQNRSPRLEIKREDHLNLKLTDVEDLIQKGYLWCDEDKGGKIITQDGNWVVVCRLTSKTLIYRQHIFWTVFQAIGGFGGIIALFQFIWNTIQNIL